MKKYFRLDKDGFVVQLLSCETAPDDCVEADMELGPPPGGGYKFHYETRQWIEQSREQRLPILSIEAQARRRRLLMESDWTQIPNGPLTAEQQTAWATYRQELRDITAQPDYPFTIVWPTPPQ